MAQNNKYETINIVSGKIILKETGQGISNLLVVLYDLDPSAKLEDFIKSLHYCPTKKLKG